LPPGFASTRVTNVNTSKPSTTTAIEVQALSPQNTQLSATELTKLLLQCLLESLRTNLNAILAMLLWTIPDFRIFIRSLNTFARQPSLLLDSNITLIDVLNREVSLPYEWFRKWPHMVAHLQYELNAILDETSGVEAHFFQYQDSSPSQCGQTVLADQWEDLVRPVSRIVMGLRIDLKSCRRNWKQHTKASISPHGLLWELTNRSIRSYCHLRSKTKMFRISVVCGQAKLPLVPVTGRIHFATDLRRLTRILQQPSVHGSSVRPKHSIQKEMNSI